MLISIAELLKLSSMYVFGEEPEVKKEFCVRLSKI